MASSNSRSSSGSVDYPTRSLKPQRPVIAAVPLNSVPYSNPSQSTVSPIPSVSNQPAMVFLPTHSGREELERVVAATSHGVAVTGSAALGKVGRPIGSIDVSESKDSYLFRVALPGVARDTKTFSWYLEADGELFIKGVTITGQRKVNRHGMEFEMLTQNLSPPGEFSISFHLPGPVDPDDIKGSFDNDGIFEGVVKKRHHEMYSGESVCKV